MRIALLGYGKMGKTLFTLANSLGHEVVLSIHSENAADCTLENLRKADIAIEFSTPQTAFRHVSLCLEAGVPVVVGTTGWLHRWEEAVALCKNHNGTIFHASNFSIGVNIFFAVNEYLASLMQRYPQYHLEIEEIHHKQKKDTPSGTAISLADGIMQHLPYKQAWINSPSDEATLLPIISHREEGVTGTHIVRYQSGIDDISIQHIAHKREGFAKGALLAAEWVLGKKGVFGMKDLLSL